MKKRISILLITLLLSGCVFKPETNSNSSTSSNDSQDSEHLNSFSLSNNSLSNVTSNESNITSSNTTSNNSSSFDISSESQSTSSSSKTNSNDLSVDVSSSSKSENYSSSLSSEISQSSSSSSIQTDVTKYIDIYAINDFHGRISENKAEYEPGISKLSTYLKSRKSKNEDGFIFLASGDIWQDTYESGYNKGALLSECLNQMGCEAMTLGNHDFDWGLDVIKKNQTLSPNCTFLCANVYNYPDTDNFANVGKEYKIIERNGLRIGIIGTIGSTQNTSITSSVWENLYFKETADVVKKVSDKLRTQENCDIVIWSNHASYDDSDPYKVTSISPVSNKRYVDAVFNAHTHQKEERITRGVAFVQGGSHGSQLSYIRLKITPEKSITVDSYSNSLGYGSISQCESDPEIDQIIAKYQDQNYLNNKNQEVGYLNSYSSTISSFYAGSLIAKATYELYKEDMEINNVSLILNNGSRDEVSSVIQTKETIYNIAPFTNYTYICKNILGREINNEIGYSNYYYKIDESLTFDDNKYYTIACIDYLLLHKGANRNYNYFTSYKEDNVVKIIKEYPFDIVARYLSQVKTITDDDFNNSHYKI